MRDWELGIASCVWIRLQKLFDRKIRIAQSFELLLISCHVWRVPADPSDFGCLGKQHQF